jgi:hypothetical protein
VIRLASCCGAALVLVSVVAPPASAVRAESISAMLRDGKAVVLSGVTVTGPLDLNRADVRAIFKCRSCTFAGSVAAQDATFERAVDLSGSRFRGALDLSGATFSGPALFRVVVVGRGRAAAERPTSFRRAADFSLATFDDLASFAGSEFDAQATFRDTRFADVTFASAEFARVGDFERASFRGLVTFSRATFRAEARLVEADFRAGARFVQTSFLGGGVFTRSQFAAGTSFLNARFVASERSEEAARFQNVTSVGDLDFTFAEFDSSAGTARANGSVVAVFSDVVCGGSLSFRDATFSPEHRITMLRLQVRDLVLGVDVVPQIDDPAEQRTVLQVIANSSKARGDLGAANDAQYELLALQSRDYWIGWRVLDRIFYRGVAGYFVRPFRPLLVLLGLATLMSILRVRRGWTAPADAAGGSRLRRVGHGLRTAVSRLLTAFLDTLSSVKSGRLGDSEGPSSGERIEVFVYRLLLVCALLGLANSNPTLREMFDTLV